MINSWDLPTYLLLFLGTLALKTTTQPETAAISGEASSGIPLIDRLAPRWRSYLANALLIVMTSLLLIAPFLLTFTSLIGGRAPLIDLPLIGAITRILGVVGSRTGLHSFLIIFGVFSGAAHRADGGAGARRRARTSDCIGHHGCDRRIHRLSAGSAPSTRSGSSADRHAAH